MSAADDDICEQLREALRFLAHDAREGHSSTLTLLELYRAGAEPALASDLVQRIERTALRSLTRIDDFVVFARARSQPMEIEEFDLLDLLYDAVAQVWQAADECGVRLKVVDVPDQALLQADRSLLRSAIVGLVQHALGRARRGSVLQWAVREVPHAWTVELDETSNGAAATNATVAPTEIQHGWALVELVARRVGGSAKQWDEPEHGLRLRVTLPRT
jgi:signal transduction histidine kinase